MALPTPSPSPTPIPVNQTIPDFLDDWIAAISSQNLNQQMKYSDALVLVQGIRDMFSAQ